METIVESDFMQAVDKELLYYLAHRYNKTPRQIVSEFLRQENLSQPVQSESVSSFSLENNEMEILRAYYRRYENENY
jgi:hypothetical protein